MHLTIRFSFLLLLGLLLSLAATCPPPTTLSGTVRDATAFTPLPGTQVRALQQDRVIATAVADSAGHFTLTLPHGLYTIECAQPGYASIRYLSIETHRDADRSLALRLRRSSDLEEWEIKTYQDLNVSEEDLTRPATPDTFPPEMPTDGMVYDTVIAFDPETYEEKVAIVARPAGARSGTELRPDVYTTPASPPVERPMKLTAPMGESGAVREGETRTLSEPRSTPAEYRVAAAKTKSSPPAYKKMEDAAMSVPASDVADKKPVTAVTPSPGTPQPRAGLLTAGEWNDLNNWSRHWLDLLQDGELDVYQRAYGFTPRHRYTVLLTNEQDVPLADVPVLLQAGGVAIWEARTDNTGKAELWKGLLPDSPADASLQVVAVVEGKVHNLGSPKEAVAGLNRYRLGAACAPPRTVDIVWAVDATGSMSDEIEYLKTELLDVIGRAKALNGDLTFRMGTTFYRDEGDEYITRSSGLSYDISKTVDFIREQRAGGGGDTPEAVHTALEEAIYRQKWSEHAIARICFIVLDASPHQTPEINASLHRSIREAARRGIRVVAVTASGIQKDTEFLMKFFGLATNGTYVFLTDHSGIGGKHLEPTTDEYKVENLNNLLVRLIGEYTTTETCEGKSAIRFEPDAQQEQPGPAAQAFYYPNPASTQFLLELPFEVTSVTLYNAEGKSVLKLENLAAGTHTVPVNSLPDGFYTLRILKDGRHQSGKILVAKGL